VGVDSVIIEGLAVKFGEVLPHLDERQRRLYLGSEARVLGSGGGVGGAAADGAGGGGCAARDLNPEPAD
jgi:hypothetical protein